MEGLVEVGTRTRAKKAAAEGVGQGERTERLTGWVVVAGASSGDREHPGYVLHDAMSALER